MRLKYSTLLLLTGFVLIAAACSKSKKDDEPIDPRTSGKSREELAEEVRRLSMTAAEKDSLFNEVVETTKFISEVYTELSALSGELNTRSGVEQRNPDYRQEITKKIQLLSKRMQDNEKRLKENQQRIQELKKSNTKFANQIASYEQVIADLNVIIENQKNEIAALNTKIADLTGKVATLTEEKTQLNDQVSNLTEEQNTCYYLVGTSTYLTSNNVIEKKGNVLFLGGKYVPADNINTGLFTAININRQTEITLPAPLYEIVSNHSLQYMKISDDKKTITITDPKKFWKTSKYLIVMVNG